MMLHDSTFFKPMMDDHSTRHLEPFVVYTMDVPSRFLEPLMLTLRAYMQAKFLNEDLNPKLDYNVFHF